MRFFVETPEGVAANWLYHLATQTITNCATLIAMFEEKFKPLEGAQALLAQLTQLKKESCMPLCEFVSHFSKLTQRIPSVAQPRITNLKCFFSNAEITKVKFLLRRATSSTPVAT